MLMILSGCRDHFSDEFFPGQREVFFLFYFWRPQTEKRVLQKDAVRKFISKNSKQQLFYISGVTGGPAYSFNQKRQEQISLIKQVLDTP